MEELSVLITRSQAGEKEAREVLIENNLGLVRHVVKRFIGRGCEAEDLFQLGAIGLMKAIDKFDLSQGVQFSTYAVPMIAGEIRRFLRDDGPIKVSRTIKENGFKIRMARQRFCAEQNREPRLSELSEQTGIAIEDIVVAMEASAEMESLSGAIYQEDGSELTLGDRVVQGEDGSPGTGKLAASLWKDDEKEQVLDRIFLQQMLSTLEGKDRSIILLRYFENKTQSDVAKILGISQVQVSRMEKRILINLKNSVNR